MRPVLVTIPISHYCEKARWALERARIAYSERRHLQIFHYPAVWLAAGGISAPAFRAGAVRLRDSTDILRWVDGQLPAGERLYPSAEALALEERFDEELGPATRRLVYFHLLDRPDEMLRFNNAGAPAFEKWLLSLIFKPARAFIERRLRITGDAVAADVTAIRGIFADVSARLADGRRYLLGDRFSAADLTFAALSSPVVIPAEYGIELPRREALPQALGEIVDEMRATPAGAFALRMFREERRPPQ